MMATRDASKSENEPRGLAAIDVPLDLLEAISLNPKQFEAMGDGMTDDFTAITNCFAAALELGVPVHFLPGTYKVSQAIVINGFTKLIIYAVGNAKVLFPSADQTLTKSTPGYD